MPTKPTSKASKARTAHRPAARPPGPPAPIDPASPSGNPSSPQDDHAVLDKSSSSSSDSDSGPPAPHSPLVPRVRPRDSPASRSPAAVPDSPATPTTSTKRRRKNKGKSRCIEDFVLSDIEAIVAGPAPPSPAHTPRSVRLILPTPPPVSAIPSNVSPTGHLLPPFALRNLAAPPRSTAHATSSTNATTSRATGLLGPIAPTVAAPAPGPSTTAPNPGPSYSSIVNRPATGHPILTTATHPAAPAHPAPATQAPNAHPLNGPTNATVVAPTHGSMAAALTPLLLQLPKDELLRLLGSFVQTLGVPLPAAPASAPAIPFSNIGKSFFPSVTGHSVFSALCGRLQRLARHLASHYATRLFFSLSCHSAILLYPGRCLAATGAALHRPVPSQLCLADSLSTLYLRPGQRRVRSAHALVTHLISALQYFSSPVSLRAPRPILATRFSLSLQHRHPPRSLSPDPLSSPASAPEAHYLLTSLLSAPTP